MRCIVTVFSLFILVTKVHSVSLRVDPLVQIEQGLVRGQLSADGGYASFLGIPYAKVNLTNPFGPSLPGPDFGEEIFNAYDGSVACPQPVSHPNMNLDCLILNVFTPTSASRKNPLPVLVYIHGGELRTGSASEYDVSNIVKKDVVVVMMNYRLGPYGFICLNSPLASGNQGFKDQYEALLWVRRNIAAFGGNPMDVTMGGISAGSRSTLFHLYSSKEKLYNKIIAQSGAIAFKTYNGDNEAIMLAEHLGFITNDTEQALQFLSSTPHDLVVGAANDLGIIFRACLERPFEGIENFLTKDDYPLRNERKVSNTPVLIGHTNTEYRGYPYENHGVCENDVFYCTLRRLFDLDESVLRNVAKTVRHSYLGDNSVSISESEVNDFTADLNYKYATERSINKLVSENANPVYSYVFSYGEFGASHAGDGLYLFQASQDNEEKQLLSNRMTTMWTNFIKYGNPTPEVSDLLPVIWEPVSKDKRPYLDINTDLEMKSRFDKEKTAFWDLFYYIYGDSQKVANLY